MDMKNEVSFGLAQKNVLQCLFVFFFEVSFVLNKDAMLSVM